MSTKKSDGQQDKAKPKADFHLLVTSLSLQASIAMGQMKHPVNHQKQENLPQARFLVDTLWMLKDKTKGNLTVEESKLLDNLVNELERQYANTTGKKE